MAAGRVAAAAVCAVLHGYRSILSPLLPGCCRFSPTCSAYAIESVERFGVRRGMILAIRRLLRCHPWGDAGDDPVPTKE